MPVIRFVREERDVECYPGENLREVALRSGIELYGLKGRLGNCGGCGQCITCFVDVVDQAAPTALTERTAVEEQKLRRRPQSWRLACQTLVQASVIVLTRPQTPWPEAEQRILAARQQELPPGPLAWPVQPEPESGSEPELEASGINADRAAESDADQAAASGAGSVAGADGQEQAPPAQS